MTRLKNRCIAIAIFFKSLLTALCNVMFYCVYSVYTVCFQLAPTGSPSLVNSMKIIQNPVKTCDKVYALIQSLNSQIRKRLEDPKSAGSVNLLHLYIEDEEIFKMCNY